jgi:tRNA (cmo5U34)-methyltransferase
LVSQFIVQQEERRNFFRQIAARLRSGGVLVSADLTSDMSTAAYQSLLEVWLRLLQSCNIPAEEIENMRASFGRSVAILPPQEVESILTASGFDAPVLFLQTLLIHAWFARRTS